MANDYGRRNYIVIPYDTNWQNLFEEKKQQIKNIFGDIRIEHIGSTAVEGMYGKPCIDILVLLDNLEVVQSKVSEMENLGYIYAGAFVMKDALLFREIRNDEVFANIHFFPLNHPHVKEMLTLRDYLRNNKSEVEAYSSLKKNLYEKYPTDYANYRKEKDSYMLELLKRVNK